MLVLAVRLLVVREVGKPVQSIRLDCGIHSELFPSLVYLLFTLSLHTKVAALH